MEDLGLAAVRGMNAFGSGSLAVRLGRRVVGHLLGELERDPMPKDCGSMREMALLHKILIAVLFVGKLRPSS